MILGNDTKNMIFEILPIQEKIYHSYEKNKDNLKFNIIKTFTLKSGIDRTKLKNDLKVFFDKYEVGRTKFIEIKKNGKNKIVGAIEDSCNVSIEEYYQQNSYRFLRPFNVLEAPLIKFALIDNKTLIINTHRILMDENYLSFLIEGLTSYHTTGCFSNILPYSEYIKSFLNSKNNITILQDTFSKNYNPISILKKENISDDTNNYQIKVKSISEIISGEHYRLIKHYLNSNDINCKSLFYGIYGFVLSKYSRQNLIFSSFMNTGKLTSNIDTVAEEFYNLKPILINYEEDRLFYDIFIEINNILLKYEEQKMTYSEISHKLNLLPVEHAMLMDTTNTLNDNPLLLSENDNSFKEDKNLFSFLGDVYGFEFILKIKEDDNHFVVSIFYNSTIYEDYTIKNILDSYIIITKNINNFDKKLRDIEYISIYEKYKILNLFNSNKLLHDNNKIYHIEFDKVVQAFPDAIALIYENKEYTYNELNFMSNSLANFLRNYGIKKNEIIPIMCDRSPFYFISILGILKAGAAYAYIDPSFPKQRIQTMIDQVNPKIILKYVKKNKNDIKYEPMVWNKQGILEYDLEKMDYTENTTPLVNINNGNDICCLFFTSGSTGKPKGVPIKHCHMTNFCLYAQTINGYKNIYDHQYNNILSFTRFGYIMSNRETLCPLLHHKTVILCNKEEYNNPEKLGLLIQKYNVEYITSTPSRISIYLDNKMFKESLMNIKIVIFGGEKISTEFLREIFTTTKADVYCSLGLTEASGIILLGKVDRKTISNKNEIPIGKPTCNYDVFILDKYLKPVPIGIEGEICVTGFSVTDGYVNLEELNKQKFITSPFETIFTDNKLYRTGDIGKWTPDGSIIYVGRNDFQVKIRGQRVEMGEIENTVKQIENIEFTVVVGQENDNGDNYLICYYSCKNSDVTAQEIRDYLKIRLPVHMIPSYYISLKSIPLNPNGKLDRKALPKPDLKKIIKEKYEAPETEIEKTLCEIYEDILNIKDIKIGKNNDFYELGGNSFNAIEIISTIENKLNIKLSIETIFNYSTIGELGNYIKSISDNFKDDDRFKVNTIKNYDSKEFPITSQQLGVYIDCIKNPESILYNMPIIIKMKDSINIEKVKKAFNALFDTQEILKSKYLQKNHNGNINIYGIVDHECSLEFEYYTDFNIDSFVRPFDLSKAPLIRRNPSLKRKLTIITITRA
ncbi:hypothetical protein PIROE2DRAFT_7101 [Piromyces sp. E2]|nr:hypothetical protein PIROE2DRAFT_7101 [Piromyces sp. E2]|eukprot:OUM65779.1 hypothetical protein PIROE2DRAFT_7101 [Piromyces sp. E2]